MKRYGWQDDPQGSWLFHVRDAVTGKARSPRVNRCTDGTTSVMVVDERRWRRPSTLAVQRMLSARYGSADRDNGMPECRDRIESVRGRTTSEGRGEAGDMFGVPG